MITTRGYHVTAVGPYDPARRRVVPFGRLDPGVEERVVDQVVPVCDRLEVRPDLLPARVPHRRDVTHLLEHGHVEVRLDVTHHARVTVPVPGAADPPGLVDQDDSLDARLVQLCAHEHTAHPRADHEDVDLFSARFALHHRLERITPIRRKRFLGEVIQSATIGSHAPSALLLVSFLRRPQLESPSGTSRPLIPPLLRQDYRWRHYITGNSKT